MRGDIRRPQPRTDETAIECDSRWVFKILFTAVQSGVGRCDVTYTQAIESATVPVSVGASRVVLDTEYLPTVTKIHIAIRIDGVFQREGARQLFNEFLRELLVHDTIIPVTARSFPKTPLQAGEVFIVLQLCQRNLVVRPRHQAYFPFVFVGQQVVRV